jgi:ElaB/YqjD/DUF883 family membrane-anchored ribosome-binding protein
MSPDTSDDRLAENAHRASAEPQLENEKAGNTEKGDDVPRTRSRRRVPKAQRAGKQRENAGVQARHLAPDDPGERLRAPVSELLAATREHIVEKPLQAVLVAVAAGAFAAMLLGAGRRR